MVEVREGSEREKEVRRVPIPPPLNKGGRNVQLHRDRRRDKRPRRREERTAQPRGQRLDWPRVLLSS